MSARRQFPAQPRGMHGHAVDAASRHEFQYVQRLCLVLPVQLKDTRFCVVSRPW
jgi:hypothetical protein